MRSALVRLLSPRDLGRLRLWRRAAAMLPRAPLINMQPIPLPSRPDGFTVWGRNKLEHNPRHVTGTLSSIIQRLTLGDCCLIRRNSPSGRACGSFADIFHQHNILTASYRRYRARQLVNDHAGFWKVREASDLAPGSPWVDFDSMFASMFILCCNGFKNAFGLGFASISPP